MQVVWNGGVTYIDISSELRSHGLIFVASCFNNGMGVTHLRWGNICHETSISALAARMINAKNW